MLRQDRSDNITNVERKETKTKEIIRTEKKESSLLMHDLKALGFLLPVSALKLISNAQACSRLRVCSLMNVEILLSGLTKSSDFICELMNAKLQKRCKRVEGIRMVFHDLTVTFLQLYRDSESNKPQIENYCFTHFSRNTALRGFFLLV